MTATHRRCSKCSEWHDRGKGYSYCRKCATEYQREQRLRSRTQTAARLEQLEQRMTELEEREVERNVAVMRLASKLRRVP